MCDNTACLGIYRQAVSFSRQVGSEGTVTNYTAVVECDNDTGLYVGYVPNFPGAHSQGATLDELYTNMQEVIAMLLEDGEPELAARFVGTQSIEVAMQGSQATGIEAR